MYSFTLSLTGSTKEALDNITIALAKDPSNVKVMYWAGLVYKNAGQHEMALQLIKDALSHDQSNAACFEAFGDIQLTDAQFTEAAQNYFHAWEKGGYTETRAIKLGTALMYEGKYPEAKDFLETIVNKNPSQQEALYRLALVYCSLNDPAKAKKMVTALGQNRCSVYQQLAQGKYMSWKTIPMPRRSPTM